MKGELKKRKGVKWDHNFRFTDWWWRKAAWYLMETLRRYCNKSVYTISVFLLFPLFVLSPPHPAPGYMQENCICLKDASAFFPHQVEISVFHAKLQLWLWKCLLYLRRYTWECVSYYLTVFYCVYWRESGQFKMQDSVFSPCWLPALTIRAGVFQALSVLHSTHYLLWETSAKIAHVFPKIQLMRKTFLFHWPFHPMLL